MDAVRQFKKHPGFNGTGMSFFSLKAARSTLSVCYPFVTRFCQRAERKPGIFGLSRSDRDVAKTPFSPRDPQGGAVGAHG
jgi:hypothetical protein